MQLHDELTSCFEHCFSDVTFYSFDCIDSTNLFLKQQAKQRLERSFCIAQRQTSGYGQRGRSWLASDDSLLFSLLLPFSEPPVHLTGLTQLVALEIAHCLNQLLPLPVSIKWPNDLYLGHRKVAGILLEVVSFNEHECWIVIGVGMNVQRTAQSGGLFNEDKRSLPETAGMLQFGSSDAPDLTQLIVALFKRLSDLAETFHRNAFGVSLNAYQKLDYFSKGQTVIVYDSGHTNTGLYQGLTEQGEIQVLMDGVLRIYSSGSVSIRPFDADYE
jgi:BirA family biotin operon repressor/biotin-[acetyl-CoA-carboxylase] ligase